MGTRDAPQLVESSDLYALPWIVGVVVLRDFVSRIAAGLRDARLPLVYSSGATCVSARSSRSGSSTGPVAAELKTSRIISGVAHASVEALSALWPPPPPRRVGGAVVSAVRHA